MKHCPVCHNQYTDPTLNFCLQDGTPLAGERQQSSIDTVSFSDPVTAHKILKTEQMYLPVAESEAVRPENDAVKPENNLNKTRKWQAAPKNPAAVPQKPKKSGYARFLLPAALPVLLAVTALGLGGWLYLKNQKPAIAQNSPVVSPAPENPEQNSPSNTSGLSNKAVLEETKLQTNSNSATPAASDPEAVKKEIADVINLWKTAADSRNLAEYTARYAETVDYFDRKAAPLAEIRGEMQKIFTTYNDIDVTLSNLRIAVDDDITRATAVFDKEWSYETDKDLLESKAHTKLQFQKKGSEWKIVGERNLKVYYLEK